VLLILGVPVLNRQVFTALLDLNQNSNVKSFSFANFLPVPEIFK